MSNNASNLYNVTPGVTTNLPVIGLPGSVLVTFVPLPLWSAFQWIIFVCGTTGNLLMLVILLWRRNPIHVVTQLLIASLAVANTGMMLSSAWIQASLYADHSWKFGLFCCRLFLFQSGLNMGCSSWTLAMTSVDSYFTNTISI